MQLQRAGSWKSATVAQTYVEDSTCGRIAIAKLLRLPSAGPPNLRPSQQPHPAMASSSSHVTSPHHHHPHTHTSNDPTTPLSHRETMKSSSHSSDNDTYMSLPPDDIQQYNQMRPNPFIITGSNNNNYIFVGSHNSCKPRVHSTTPKLSGTKRKLEPSSVSSHEQSIEREEKVHLQCDDENSHLSLLPMPISSTSMDMYSQYDDL